MADTLFLSIQAREAALVGVRYYFVVTALNSSGAIDTGFTGTVTFTSSDPDAVLPANYTFVGGDAGVHTFPITFGSVGAQSITASAGGSVDGTLINVNVIPEGEGWGFDPYGISPFGGAEAGVGLKLLSAVAISTNQVNVTLNEEPTNIGPFNPGDAFNPAVWTIQNLATTDFLQVVDVQAVSPTVYTLTTLQSFPDFHTTLQVGSTTLLDQQGTPITNPRSANFLGMLSVVTSSAENQSVQQGTTSRDLKNAPTPSISGNVVGGTLVVTGAGDYGTMQGVALLRKLVLRRIFTKPGDFFHLPTYGVGIQEKGPLPIGQLTKLRKVIVDQVSQEPELENVTCGLSLDSNNVLTIQLLADVKPTGQELSLSVPVQTTGVSL